MLKTALPLLALGLALAPVASAAPVLLELFTSEGCSSCPPADKLLGELAASEDVLPLAFHVTYWDGLGWPDPFARSAFTQRQRDYAQQLGRSNVYTPQLVIGGRADVVGSDRDHALAAIRLLREHAEPAAITFAGGRAVLPAVRLDRPVGLWLAAFDGHHRVSVTAGENAGQVLDHDNVVREFDRLGSWDGSARTVELPVDHLRQEYRVGLALVAQDPANGNVVALGRLRF